MLNDYGKSLLKPWLSVQNFVLISAAMFLIVLFKFTSNEIASWVQAIGSIAAIWGAFKIGEHQHKQRLAQREEDEILKKQATKKLVLRLAQDSVNQLSELKHVLHRSFRDFGEHSITPYVIKGSDIRWHYLLDALNSLDVREMDDVQTMHIIDLKVGCAFAIKVCERLSSWNCVGDEELILATRIFYHTEKAEEAYTELSPLKTE